MDNWISCKDGLPKANRIVLICAKYVNHEPMVCVSCLTKAGKWVILEIGDAYPDGVVTHWMPLPEPPKEEENSNIK